MSAGDVKPSAVIDRRYSKVQKHSAFGISFPPSAQLPPFDAKKHTPTQSLFALRRGVQRTLKDF